MPAAGTGLFRPHELFDRLVDDAAVFPPGNAPLPDAVPAHLAYRDAPFADLVGPFLCPASRLGELRATVVEGTALDVRIVLDTGIGGLEEAVAEVRRSTPGPAFVEHGFEVPIRAETDLAGAARRLAAALRSADVWPGKSIFVEVPRTPSTHAALDVLSDHELHAKLRTGGADAEAFPSEAELADFVLACLDREIGFKLTAGLHHAVRHTDSSTGFEEHGFLNVMLAVDVALGGGDRAAVAAQLGDRDAEAVADRVRALEPGRARRIRRWFVSYGSCSIAEPVDELTSLGLFEVQPTDRPS